MDERRFRVLLGVTGSVAAYRAADLARTLMRAGADVRVCLTRGALEFVTVPLFEALTGAPALVDVFEEPERGRMAHIDLARWADVILVAPATANTVAKLASGVADNMLTTVVAASTSPLVVAPAMNPAMYGAEPFQEALAKLELRGATVVQPLEGDVACGEHGQGKLAEIGAICERTLSVLRTKRLLQGKRVLITSGPTQEPIDAVRFLSNRSSGKMGAALAKAALGMGAEVTVVAGPSAARYPNGARTIHVRTAQEMLWAGLQETDPLALIIGVAAVADFRPAHPSDTKIRRSGQSLSLELIENPDVISELAAHHRTAKTIAFAAEPSAQVEPAAEKMRRKGVFGIATNDISNAEIGFESDRNELTLLLENGRTFQSGVHSKFLCAQWLLNTVCAELGWAEPV